MATSASRVGLAPNCRSASRCRPVQVTERRRPKFGSAIEPAFDDAGGRVIRRRFRTLRRDRRSPVGRVARGRRRSAEPSDRARHAPLSSVDRGGLIGDRGRVQVRSLCAGQVKHDGTRVCGVRAGPAITGRLANVVELAVDGGRPQGWTAATRCAPRTVAVPTEGCNVSGCRYDYVVVREVSPEPRSLEAVYRESWLACLLVGDRTEAEDVVQTVFMTAAARWDRIDEPWAYLRFAVVNRAPDARPHDGGGQLADRARCRRVRQAARRRQERSRTSAHVGP